MIALQPTHLLPEGLLIDTVMPEQRLLHVTGAQSFIEVPDHRNRVWSEEVLRHCRGYLLQPGGCLFPPGPLREGAKSSRSAQALKGSPLRRAVLENYNMRGRLDQDSPERNPPEFSRRV